MVRQAHHPELAEGLAPSASSQDGAYTRKTEDFLKNARLISSSMGENCKHNSWILQTKTI
ncbi:MAG: hypothetical protein NT145_01290 [Elusimicrobia bacterium]|nr:hypothetical protein [Elusimicrobiota bacterium]